MTWETVLGITLQGQPVPKNDLRFDRRRTSDKPYRPDTLTAYQKRLRETAWVAMIASRRTALSGPVSVTLRFYLRGKDVEETPIAVPAPIRPDVDNLSKAVLDGLKGICFLDDDQVVDLRLSKAYAGTGRGTRLGTGPRVEIEVGPFREDLFDRPVEILEDRIGTLQETIRDLARRIATLENDLAQGKGGRP